MQVTPARLQEIAASDPKRAEHARGWGVRVNGPCPYLAWEIHPRKVEAVEGCTEPYHRPVKVVLVPLEWYRRAKGKIEEND